MNDPEATDKQEELTAMSISCDAAILLAERHADLADEMSLTEKDPRRTAELRKYRRGMPPGSRLRSPRPIGKRSRCTGLSTSVRSRS